MPNKISPNPASRQFNVFGRVLQEINWTSLADKMDSFDKKHGD